jgi:hypothetical protein
MPKRRHRKSRTPSGSSRRSEKKRLAREQRERQQIAIWSTGIAAILWGGGFAYGVVTMRQTGHVRLSLQFLLFLVVVSLGAAWAVWDWFRHR